MNPFFAELIKGRAGTDKLFWTSSTEHTSRFHAALELLQCHELNVVRYSRRHAAASQDLLSKSRTHEEVKARFRWKSDFSMRRYAKAARLEFFAKKIPPQVMAYGDIVKTELPRLFAGLKIKPPFA